MTEELNMETTNETEHEIVSEDTETTEKAPRKPRTTTYYAFSNTEDVITFSGTKEEAKAWLKDNVPPSGNSEIGFYLLRGNWWVLMTGEGAGEHQCEENTTPEAITSAVPTKGAKTPRVKTVKTKFKAETKLERNVMKWAKGQEFETGVTEALTTLLGLGCTVEHLASFEQSTKFYRKHRIEISMLITDCIRDGLIKSAGDIEGWDVTDPLAQGVANQNLLARFGFEVSARNLCDRAGVEV